MLERVKSWVPRKKATALAYAEPADISALQALERGDADEFQQRRALSFIVYQLSGMYEFNYYPDDRDTSFALGRAFVGQQIVGHLKIHVPSITKGD